MRFALSTSRSTRLRRQSDTRSLALALVREPELIAALVGPGRGVGVGAPTAVRSVLLEAVERGPDYADLQYFCARALMQIDEDERAEALLERAIRLNPEYVDALVLSGRLACRLGKTAEAIGHLSRAVELGADYADVHKLLGDLRQRAGESRAARDSYERALLINPNFASARIAKNELTG